MSADYRPTLSVECRSSIGRDIGRHLLSADSVRRLLVKLRPTLSVEGWSSIGRDIERHTPPTYSIDISADTRPILDRHFCRHLGEISTDTWSSDGQNSTQVCRPSVATIGRSVGLHSVDSSTDILDRHLGRHSTKCRSISCPRVGRDVGRVSAEISAKCRPRSRPIVSVECRSSIVRHIDRHTPLTYSTDILH